MQPLKNFERLLVGFNAVVLSVKDSRAGLWKRLMCGFSTALCRARGFSCAVNCREYCYSGAFVGIAGYKFSRKTLKSRNFPMLFEFGRLSG